MELRRWVLAVALADGEVSPLVSLRAGDDKEPPEEARERMRAQNWRFLRSRIMDRREASRARWAFTRSEEGRSLMACSSPAARLRQLASLRRAAFARRDEGEAVSRRWSEVGCASALASVLSASSRRWLLPAALPLVLRESSTPLSASASAQWSKSAKSCLLEVPIALRTLYPFPRTP